MNLLAAGIVLPWIIVGFGCWIGYLLLRQSGRILQRLELLEERLAHRVDSPSRPLAPSHLRPTPLPSGLAIGADAPPFDLPTLAGQRTALSDFRGRRLLLIFFNPRCGFCERMVGDLGALPTDGSH